MVFRDDFAIFIISRGRVNNVYTLKALQKGKYTGKCYFLVDNDDEQLEEYKTKYGRDNVIVMDKEKTYQITDTMDNFHSLRAIIYARNELFRIVKSMGLKYFLQLDDDYTSFEHRWYEGGKLRGVHVYDYDRLFNDMIHFMETTKTTTIAFAQGGDFIGGAMNQNYYKGLMRKAMNSFFCDVDRPIEFRGTMNEDVTTYTTLSSRGKLFFTYTGVCITPMNTQSLSGGMTENYLDTGTYVKSFYSVMSMPSAVKVGLMGAKNKRIHHHVSWDNCTPMIISGVWKK